MEYQCDVLMTGVHVTGVVIEVKIKRSEYITHPTDRHVETHLTLILAYSYKHLVCTEITPPSTCSNSYINTWKRMSNIGYKSYFYNMEKFAKNINFLGGDLKHFLTITHQLDGKTSTKFIKY